MTLLRRIKSRWLAWRYGPILNYLGVMRAIHKERFFEEIAKCLSKREGDGK